MTLGEIKMSDANAQALRSSHASQTKSPDITRQLDQRHVLNVPLMDATNSANIKQSEESQPNS